MDKDEIITAVQQAVEINGGKPYPIERRARLPADAIRNILAGHEPGAFKLARVCRALGLEFYVGPMRGDPGAVARSEPERSGGMLSTAWSDDLEGTAVTDRDIAAVVAVLADEYEELDATRRKGLLTRFWSFFPDLRERERTLARVVAWLGWRVVEGRTVADGRRRTV